MPCASIGRSPLPSADSGRPLAMPSIRVGIEQIHRGAPGRQRRPLWIARRLSVRFTDSQMERVR
jgi:hypothetical protein